MHPVAASRRDDVTSLRRCPRQGWRRRRATAGHERRSKARRRECRRTASMSRHEIRRARRHRREVLPHTAERFRIRPVRLHGGQHFRRQLLHFADHVLEQGGGGSAEHAAELSRRSGRAAAEQREAKAHHTKAREQGTHTRQEDAAGKGVPLIRRRIAPFVGMERIDEHQSRDVCRVRARECADDERAERMCRRARTEAECRACVSRRRSSPTRTAIERALEARSLHDRPARS